MSTNNLTPVQDVAFRDFFRTVAMDENVLSDSPAHRRQLLAICLEALNYVQLPGGQFVDRAPEVPRKIQFGSSDYSAYPCEWAADEEKAYAAINSESEPETSTSSKGEDTTVRKAVLSKDV